MIYMDVCGCLWIYMDFIWVYMDLIWFIMLSSYGKWRSIEPIKTGDGCFDSVVHDISVDDLEPYQPYPNGYGSNCSTSWNCGGFNCTTKHAGQNLIKLPELMVTSIGVQFLTTGTEWKWHLKKWPWWWSLGAANWDEQRWAKIPTEWHDCNLPSSSAMRSWKKPMSWPGVAAFCLQPATYGILEFSHENSLDFMDTFWKSNSFFIENHHFS